MQWVAFFGWIALLYYGCALLLLALVTFVAWTGGRRAKLRLDLLLLSLCLLLWQLTLFVETRTTLPELQLALGRLNFAVMALAPLFCLRFVQAVPRSPIPQHRLLLRGNIWNAAIGSIALLTLFSPYVDAAETVVEGQPISTFGPLFPLYLLQVMGVWTAAVVTAFGERRRAKKRIIRDQLTLIGVGILSTGTIAFVTNALLPYFGGDFRFCDLGVLSSLCFLLAVAYATLVLRLFDLRTWVRQSLVYGLLLTGVLGIYSSTVFVVTQYLTDHASKITQFAVLVLAFSFDPIRRWLEKKADEWLFDQPELGAQSITVSKRKRRGRARSRLPHLAILFSWR